ncbi:MAG: hypothetical protein P4L38_02035 [Syntrophaceae bacterium]|nr:hypothetical protein [Syntrophaceae bacterium]
MASLSVGPGDDIDAWCGKCLMVLSHRIIAVVGNQVKKVECLTCHAIHAFKQGVGQKISSTLRNSPSSTARTLKSATPKPGKAENEWNAFMAEMPVDIVPRKYGVFESFVVSEFIEHSTFGIGKVLDITGAERMLVIFREGRKTLIFNRTQST